MAKKGMRRYDAQPPQGTDNDRRKRRPEPPRSDAGPVPELQGGAKRSKEKSDPMAIP